jgi:hypothetical protein
VATNADGTSPSADVVFMTPGRGGPGGGGPPGPGGGPPGPGGGPPVISAPRESAAPWRAGARSPAV